MVQKVTFLGNTDNVNFGCPWLNRWPLEKVLPIDFEPRLLNHAWLAQGKLNGTHLSGSNADNVRPGHPVQPRHCAHRLTTS